MKEEISIPDRAPFVLSPIERTWFGVDFDGSTLSIGPSGGRCGATIGMACGYSLFAVLFIAMGLRPGENSFFNGLPVKNGTPLVVLGVGILAWIIPVTRIRLGQRIICTPDGITIPRTLTKGPTHLEWHAVRAIRTASGGERYSTFVSPTSIHWRRNWITEYDWPRIIAADGRVLDVETLATAAASEGWHRTGPSGTENRVGLILRYHASLGIPWAGPCAPLRFPS